MRMFNRPTVDSEKPAPTTDSWWLGLSPAEFYTEARKRHPELSRKFGSAEIRTFGDAQPGIGERKRSVREKARDQIARGHM